MLLSELVAYHGGGSLTADMDLHLPLFVSTTKSGAVWYAQESGNDPTVVKLDVRVKKPLDVINGDVSMEDIARQAGIEFKEDPYFDCDEITEYGGNHGNPSDLIYIPKFVKALRAAGYDSVKLWDTLENDAIKAYILLDRSQYKILGVQKLNTLEQ